jgi:hypothetical protein
MRFELGAILAFVAWIAIAFNLAREPSIASIAYIVGFYVVGAAIAWAVARYSSSKNRSQPHDSN